MFTLTPHRLCYSVMNRPAFVQSANNSHIGYSSTSAPPNTMFGHSGQSMRGFKYFDAAPTRPSVPASKISRPNDRSTRALTDAQPLKARGSSFDRAQGGQFTEHLPGNIFSIGVKWYNFIVHSVTPINLMNRWRPVQAGRTPIIARAYLKRIFNY